MGLCILIFQFFTEKLIKLERRKSGRKIQEKQLYIEFIFQFKLIISNIIKHIE